MSCARRSLLPTSPMRSIVAVALLSVTGTVAGAQDFPGVEVEAIHVSGPVHMLTGAGGNLGASVGDDGVLLVDDQFASMVGRIREALAGIGGDEIRLVVNTHWHGDHTGGNAALGGEAILVAHENVRATMAVPSETAFRASAAAPSVALPVVTFAESVDLHWNGEQVKVVHLPGGHTDGDSYVWFTESNVVHLGDHFFSGTFPFVDLKNGGNALGLADNIGKLVATLPADCRLIPGHGPLSDMDDLRRYHDMLVETIAHVEAAWKRGASPEDLAAAGLPAEWSSWGGGFIDTDTWIAIIADSLEATRER